MVEVVVEIQGIIGIGIGLEVRIGSGKVAGRGGAEGGGDEALGFGEGEVGGVVGCVGGEGAGGGSHWG